ncbi:MAG: hypothetical protein AB7O49_21120 [Sphingomonadales bacterium]
MKPLWIAVSACLLMGCQSDEGLSAKAGDDKPVTESKVKRDADRDRRTQAIQEQWRGSVQH